MNTIGRRVDSKWPGIYSRGCNGISLQDKRRTISIGAYVFTFSDSSQIVISGRQRVPCGSNSRPSRAKGTEAKCMNKRVYCLVGDGTRVSGNRPCKCRREIFGQCFSMRDTLKSQPLEDHGANCNGSEFNGEHTARALRKSA